MTPIQSSTLAATHARTALDQALANFNKQREEDGLEPAVLMFIGDDGKPRLYLPKEQP